MISKYKNRFFTKTVEKCKKYVAQNDLKATKFCRNGVFYFQFCDLPPGEG